MSQVKILVKILRFGDESCDLGDLARLGATWDYAGKDHHFWVGFSYGLWGLMLRLVQVESILGILVEPPGYM